MTKRDRVCIAACLIVAAVAGVLVMMAVVSNPGEPVYQGKPLSF
jgi:hypothetical protein